jgi:hypothetical protein
VASRPYPVDLPEDYIGELERLADQANMSPGEMLMNLTGDLRRRSVGPPGMAVATADGFRAVITSSSYDA